MMQARNISLDLGSSLWMKVSRGRYFHETSISDRDEH
jgi:hypothetical protein